MYSPFLPKEKAKGLGDTLEKVIHKTGLDNLAKAYTKVTGKPCHCQKRKDQLNELFPYNQEVP